ncbi:WD repeat-containing protein 74 [Ditylenchus destructor]|uniref:WD repeat-containing protein 74 n=1 Tax=Ditylenchus destructor TaxID=166010 RepID=A0AAD4N444_9BILA|nr:WD repeat-containing protein 74 [Ditylenchus destructor]
MPLKRKSKISIDQMLRDDISGKNSKKVTQVEKILRSETRGLSNNEIKFTKCNESLDASTLVDSSKVVVLEPEFNTGIDCYVGTATGMLKVVDFKSKKITNITSEVSSLKPKDEEILHVTFSDSSQTEILVCRADRQLKLYNALTSTYSDMFKIPDGKGKIVGLQVTNNTNIITAAESGDLRIWNAAGEMLSSEKWSAGDNLLTMRLAPTGDIVATGGKENLLKLWDIRSEKPTFTAKNVAPDSLELRVPIWDTNVRFFNDGRYIVTTTGQHQIRVYDPRVQRRPIRDFEWLDEPIQALSNCCRDNFVLVGNSRGELGLIDLRTKISLAQKYRGFAGSLRCIDAHPTEPIFASCGIDRFVVVHDLNTRKILKKVYCKAQLNAVLISRNNSLVKQETKEEEFEDDNIE